MSDLISKSILFNHLNDWALSESPDERMDEAERDYQQIVYEVISGCMKTVEEQPTVEAVPVVRGEWILLDECSNAGVYCSNCHKKVYKEHYANVKIKSSFCPNCGAKMDLKGE